MRTVSLLVASAGTLGNLDIISTSLGYLAVIAHCFSFASEEFFPVSDTGGVAGVAGESRLPGDPPPISLRDCCIGITAVDKHTVEHVSETKQKQ